LLVARNRQRVLGSPSLEKSAAAQVSSFEELTTRYVDVGGVAMRSRVDLRWWPGRSAYALKEVLAEEA
jgi:hypothetical protein